MLTVNLRTDTKTHIRLKEIEIHVGTLVIILGSCSEHISVDLYGKVNEEYTLNSGISTSIMSHTL